MLRSEVGSWHVPIPHLTDVLHRSSHHWRRPVALASALGATVLALLLLLAVVMVAVNPAIPNAELIRAHLMNAP